METPQIIYTFSVILHVNFLNTVLYQYGVLQIILIPC